MPDTLPDVPGLNEMAPSFLRAFVDAARSVNVDADRLAVLVSHESRFLPSIQNSETRATGLIQFMPSTARALGTTVDALKRMSATEQLPYVAAFFAPYHGRLAPRDVIIAALGTGVGKPDDTIVFEEGSTGYRQNPGLDTNHDGVISLGDVRAQSDNMLAAAARKPRLIVPDAGSSPPADAMPAQGRAPAGGAFVGLLVLAGLGAALRKVAAR
jgi:hypothetical protein